MDTPLTLTSARLVLREAEAEDLPALLAVYQSNPEFVAHQEGSRGAKGRFMAQATQAPRHSGGGRLYARDELVAHAAHAGDSLCGRTLGPLTALAKLRVD